MKYKLSDKVNEQLVLKNINGVLSYHQIKCINPFGAGSYFDNTNLTDSVAEFLLTKKEYKDIIVLNKEKK